MSNYEPAPVPLQAAGLNEYLARELRRFADTMRENAPRVAYITSPLSPGFTADNFKPEGLGGSNVVRISASATQTLTGIAIRTPYRQLVVVNVGTGVVVLKSEAAESSASNRLALAANWNLSANAAAVLWRDPQSARWRGISRT